MRFGIFLLLLTLCCTNVIIDGGAADKVASISAVAGNEDFTIIKHFKTTGRAWYLLWGFLKLSNPDVGDMVRKYSGGGDGVINLKITDAYTFWDCLFEGFFGSLISITSRSVTIEGDVIKYKKSRNE